MTRAFDLRVENTWQPHAWPDESDYGRLPDHPARMGVASTPIRISATPCVYRDPRTIPPRQWLFGRHYIRKFATATAAASGIGKTSMIMTEAASMASGRALLGGLVPKQLRVWLWNLEDPIEECEKRLAGLMLHYGLSADDMGDRLYMDSGRTSPLIIATKVRDQVLVAEPLVDEIIRELKAKAIDCLVIDPFVSSHGVPENDNGAIDRVAKTWARIADETNCAVELVHHVRKPANGSSSDFTVDDARGAVALIGAVRSARVINVMSKEDAEKAGIPPNERRSYFRVDNGKSNMQPPTEQAVWRKLIGVPLHNDTPDDAGDWIGVATAWTMPGALDGLSAADIRTVQDRIAAGNWAESVQASDWAGFAVAEALGLVAGDDGVKQRIKMLLKVWLASKVLRVERKPDPRHGREKPMIVVGEWV